MTSTVIDRRRGSFGGMDVVVVTLDITSYPTNGESLTNAKLGLEGTEKARILSVVGLEAGGLDKTFQHDRANEKLKIAVANTGAEVANETDLGEFHILAVAPKGGK